MCVKNTHFKFLKSYYRDSRVKLTHLFLKCSGLEMFRSQNTKDSKNDMVIVKFDVIYSKLSYSASKVQYFAGKNSHHDTFFPKLKHSLTKIVNLGFSVICYRHR